MNTSWSIGRIKRIAFQMGGVSLDGDTLLSLQKDIEESVARGELMPQQLEHIKKAVTN